MKLANLFIILFSLSFILLSSCKNENVKYIVPEYKNWKKPVSAVLDKPVPGHGATFRIIYANDVAFSMKVSQGQGGEKELRMPDGSVIIKEVYEKRSNIGRKTPTLTIMVKDSKNSDSNDGWLYYLKKPQKDAILVKSRMCVGCHVSANEEHPYFDGNKNESFRDYLFVPFK